MELLCEKIKRKFIRFSQGNWEMKRIRKNLFFDPMLPLIKCFYISYSVCHKWKLFWESEIKRFFIAEQLNNALTDADDAQTF